ncbi:relaxase/mobilization nuclease domain-containing protein (plasmid) [Brevundimonas staleyi]|uniref:Relaxase/mobilization nuclease domain-containing protein n=1 Tax=Brevundimonas staleyi TaxID=74326 RepID=A0ABW0FRL4_9CAUL
MSDFGRIKGFEDLWRPVARDRRVPDRAVLKPGRSGGGAGEAKARLGRLAARAPEVMVKITGRTRDGDHLKAHLEYIARDGALTLEGRDGERLQGLDEIRERGSDWTADDIKKRADSSLSISVMLSMPAGTPPGRVRDAARAFAAEQFGDRHDYVFALHTDVDHPHVHIAVRTLGEGGQRLNPRKADLEAWRQSFARHLRNRDVEAEATPRRARGIVRKPERMPVRKLRERHERDPQHHPRPDRLASAEREAQRIAGGERLDRPWEGRILRQQRAVRAAYQATAETLAASGDPADRTLGAQVAAFVRSMPPIATRRNDLVRQAKAERGRETEPVTPPTDRPRPDRRR